METKLYFASNRDMRFETSKNADNFGERFNELGPQFLRVGVVGMKLKDGTDPRDEHNRDIGRATLYDENRRARKPEKGLG